MKEYRAIIFDLGNVLLRYSFELMFQKWADLTSDSFDCVFFKTHFQFDNQLRAYEKGLISTQEYFAHVTEMLGIAWDFSDFKAGWEYILIGVPKEIFPMLDRLKPNYQLYILSNTNELHANLWRRDYTSLLAYFDGIFCSHELHLHKPDPQIYSEVARRIAIPPEHLLFVDDMERNVISARTVGIDAIHAQNPAQIVEDMQELGIFENLAQPEMDQDHQEISRFMKKYGDEWYRLGEEKE